MVIIQGLCLISCTGSSEADGLLLTPKGLGNVPKIPFVLLLPLASVHVSKCCCWTVVS